MNMPEFTLHVALVDFGQKCLKPSKVTVTDGYIRQIEPLPAGTDVIGIMAPGFVDAHVHIESSMLLPSRFGRWAAAHGTVATVSDPHEIANVCGLAGVKFMIREAANSPIKTFFGAPSCVPATTFETAGAIIDLPELEELFNPTDGTEPLRYLSEMMNYPGVIFQDPAVMARIALAQQYQKPVDGHAPGLRGDQLRQYVKAGIFTDHECFTLPEAQEKASLGMHILIREGSAARNFEALHPLIAEYPQQVMFCSDDKHPDDLLKGHINQLVIRAVEKGHDVFDVLKAASLNPINYYQLPVGQCRVGDPADFIILDNLADLNVTSTYVNGKLVGQASEPIIGLGEIPAPKVLPNQFDCKPVKPDQLQIRTQSTGTASVNVIIAESGQLITKSEVVTLSVQNETIIPAIDQDVLQIVVYNRYQPDTTPALAFINGFGLKQGALASTVAHDSHNIVAVGTDHESLATAINLVIAAQGGIAVAGAGVELVLPLPVAGLMSADEAEVVGHAYEVLDQQAKNLCGPAGSPLAAPFMTLSFMALLVIPQLKLSDKGLFDGQQFRFTPLEV